MKVVILAGGLGTRLSEETIVKPKPMVEIGGKPMLWHIMNIYGACGFNEFTVALGYKGAVIKEYFLNYYNLQSDLTVSLKNGEITASKNCYRDWTVHLIDTGLNTMTGGRLLRLKDKLSGSAFMLTYGDGLSNIDINRLLEFHKSHGKVATITAVRPSARFGGMAFDGDRVVEFKEKAPTGQGWINGGFFVFEPAVFDYIADDAAILEQAPLESLSKEGQLMAYKHDGFWQCMDTVRDRGFLEDFWNSGKPPWKIWKD
ncbi:MAG: glucose-1-phosphate cytidylyltransferase [Nitrospirae bacterium GWB2_47_37]|nr:MAG: glucose-1-phosphate cytidylyltransferase [Nitrospirae bacterium GWB2_47_37]HAK89632.1 glucose-1-phosphate cytidylyltransferase [Nitrospiraceae bacterium]